MDSAGLHIPVVDLVIILAYLGGILAVGVLSVRRQTMTGEAYFLAGRSLGWAMIGAALFASNISTIHLVGLAASGYNEGLVWGNFEWMAAFTLVILSLFFAPFYFRNKIETLPEYLERRFNAAARSFLAFMAILGALFIHIGMSLYAGATVFEQFFGVDVVTSILIISLVTGIYTVLGGLKAVVVTETIQTVLLIGGSVLVHPAGCGSAAGGGRPDLGGFRGAFEAPATQHGVARQFRRPGLVFRAARLPGPRHLVLVHGPDHRCSACLAARLGATMRRSDLSSPASSRSCRCSSSSCREPSATCCTGTGSVPKANQVLPVLIQELVPTRFFGA